MKNRLFGRLPRATLVAAALVGAILVTALGSGAGSAAAGADEKPVITKFVLSAPGTKSTKFTKSTKVNVTLAATDDVRVKKYYLCDGCTEPPVVGSVSWLAAKPRTFTTYSAWGIHTVRAWVQDGSENVSKPVTAKIFLDYVKPNLSINFPRTQERLAKLTRIGGDVGELAPSSGIAKAEYAILRRVDCSWWDPDKEEFVKGRCGAQEWVEFTVPVTAKVYATNIGTLDEKGTYALTVRLTDRAGNVAFRVQKFFIV